MLNKNIKRGVGKSEDALFEKTDSVHNQKIHIHTTDTLFYKDEHYTVISQL